MARKVIIPMELKYDFALRAYTSIYKGFFYAIREECDAATAFKVYERLCKMGDRIKNLANFVLTVFKIEGNDVEAIDKWFDIWAELMGMERIILEETKTFSKAKITKCNVKTEFKDIDGHCLIFTNIIFNTINPKAIVERPKGMCAGDPYCEFIAKIEE